MQEGLGCRNPALNSSLGTCHWAAALHSFGHCRNLGTARIGVHLTVSPKGERTADHCKLWHLTANVLKVRNANAKAKLHVQHPISWQEVHAIQEPRATKRRQRVQRTISASPLHSADARWCLMNWGLHAAPLISFSLDIKPQGAHAPALTHQANGLCPIRPSRFLPERLDAPNRRQSHFGRHKVCGGLLAAHQRCQQKLNLDT